MANVVIYSRVMFCILWLYDLICFVNNTKLKTLKINKNNGKEKPAENRLLTREKGL